MPWYLRDLALPSAMSAILTLIRVDGRPFHVAAWAIARYVSEPRTLCALRRADPLPGRWWPAALLVVPDGYDGPRRRVRYAGPGVVSVSVAHERSGRGRQDGWGPGGCGADVGSSCANSTRGPYRSAPS